MAFHYLDDPLPVTSGSKPNCKYDGIAAQERLQSSSFLLAAEDIDALEARTEGWIAGLQLAALSLQGHRDATSFIRSFTGSSRFIIDYLAEEVLERQPEAIRAFLLRTSVLV